MAYIYDMAATWAAAGTTFTAIKMNVTDSASAAGSLLMDLQVGGVSRFNVDKTGAVVISDGTSALTIDSTNGATTFLQTAAITLQTSNSMVLRHGNNDALFIRPATTGRGRLAFVDNTNGSPAYIYSDAANTLDQRNGVNAQAFSVYNTFTDASNYERVSMRFTNNAFYITQERAGTGIQRSVNIGSNSGAGSLLRLNVDGSINFFTSFVSGNPWNINTAGHFVSGADNTFDIGASGATRPRRLFLGGGSLTGSEAINSLAISPTWNTSGTPTAVLLNVTDTASAAGSLLMDLQVGGVSRARVRKDGRFIGTDFELATGQAVTNNGGIMWLYGPGVIASGGVRFAAVNGNETDTVLARDAANTLAQRNGVNAQAFRLYETFTDASNFSRLAVFYDTGNSAFVLNSGAAGTGTQRPLGFATGGTVRWTVGATTGHLLAGADNTYDIGASGATRPRDIYVASMIYAGNGIRADGNNGIQALSGPISAIGANGRVELAEVSTPAAPSANRVRIYAEDNGAGKTRLMALFATGAAVQIAIEP